MGSYRPPASSTRVTAQMKVQRRRDTLPEVLVRRALFARGARYRVNYPVPGNRRRTIDIAFTRSKIAVFIDGCFWHGCPDHGTSPRANGEWWTSKIAANSARDLETTHNLIEQGWLVLRFWEHDEPSKVADSVLGEVRGRQMGCQRLSRGGHLFGSTRTLQGFAGTATGSTRRRSVPL